MIEIGVLEVTTMCTIAAKPIVLIWVSIVAHRNLDKLEEIFAESALVEYNRIMFGRWGLPGRVVRCGAIFMACIRPNWHAAKGLVKKADLSRMTKRMKFTLYPPFIAMFIVVMGTIVCGGIIRWGQR
ncbi:hypothetical protein [Pseudomonas abietaniphila]|uniref:hypothetical protein n=1 Tax=Pseudomonas abietaniphila TaxID=89065 RepID=UPI000782BEA3|nr:hypothetical protein [Pseudomonas abietaniphila]